MKKFTLLLAIIFIYSTTLSQSCLPEGITFSTQAQIDNFHIDFPGCTVIEGNVNIWGGSNNITNLNGLSVLTAIDGWLWIEINPFLGSLTGLDNVTSIGGYLYIRYNASLTDLTGLDNVTSIGGQVNINSNSSLTSLTGLGNVTTIGSYLMIWACNITDLSGLDNVTTVGGDLDIHANDMLTSLTGLENLTTVGLNIWIDDNDLLTNLSGLENLTSAGGGLFIEYNETLTDLTPLLNLSTLDGTLRVKNNLLLTELTGLDNIDPESILHLSIYDNPLLPMCEVQSVCDYLASPNGITDIHDNAPGCNSAEEIEALCPACPENIEFTTQAQIDNFQTDYPGCTVIEGNVSIAGFSNNITNLNGLSVLTAIGGVLTIDSNPVLGSLTGLDNLTSIGGNLTILNNTLVTDLTGLSNLAFIGGFLKIYSMESLLSLSGLENITSIANYLYIYFCPLLTDLTGLDNVTSIGGYLRLLQNDMLISLTGLENLNNIGEDIMIEDNDVLTSLSGLDNLSFAGGLYLDYNETLSDLSALNSLSSLGNGSLRVLSNPLLTELTGLDNIDYESIHYLYIFNNPLLPLCEVQSICDYLTDPDPDPGRVIEIHDNAPGCNTEEEVVEKCAVGVSDINTESFAIYPNPATNEIFISTNKGTFINNVNIYNQLGQTVLLQNRVNNSIDVSMLQPGVYVIELVVNKNILRERLIIK